MDPVAEYSVWKEAALVISLLSNFVNLVGFVSNAWAIPRDREIDDNFEGLGLWRYCTHEVAQEAVCLHTTDMDLPSWFEATQAMMALGFAMGFIALVALIISECVKAYRADVRALIAAIITTFAATVLNVTGVIVFGTCIHTGEPLVLPGEPEGMTYDVSWSYVTCAVAAGFSTFAGVSLIFEYINNKTLRYVKKLDGANTTSNQFNTGRIDTSFSPYTSFPDLEEPVSQNGTTVINSTVDESVY